MTFFQIFITMLATHQSVVALNAKNYLLSAILGVISLVGIYRLKLFSPSEAQWSLTMKEIAGTLGKSFEVFQIGFNDLMSSCNSDERAVILKAIAQAGDLAETMDNERKGKNKNYGDLILGNVSHKVKLEEKLEDAFEDLTDREKRAVLEHFTDTIETVDKNGNHYYRWDESAEKFVRWQESDNGCVPNCVAEIMPESEIAELIKAEKQNAALDQLDNNLKLETEELAPKCTAEQEFVIDNSEENRELQNKYFKSFSQNKKI